MTQITVAELAQAPQLNSRRVARDLIEWLHNTKGYVIVKIEDVFEPAPATPTELSDQAFRIAAIGPVTPEQVISAQKALELLDMGWEGEPGSRTLRATQPAGQSFSGHEVFTLPAYDPDISERVAPLPADFFGMTGTRAPILED